MKKMFFMILLSIYICISANVYAETGSTGELQYIYNITPEQNFIFDTNPKIEVQTYLPDNAVSNYQLRLYVDDLLKDIITIRETGGNIVKNIYEFPIYTEGQHTIKVEFLKDGIVDDNATNATCSKNITYVKSINPGYSQRGFAGHWGHGTSAYDSYDAQFYKAIGADVVRDAIYWKSVETVKGKYSYSTYDSLYKTVFEMSAEPLFVLSGTNSLYVNNNISRDSIPTKKEDGSLKTEAEIDAEWETEKLKIRTDEQIEAYANFVLDVAKHYPNVKKYEIQNEPGFSYTGTEYSKIALAAAKKLKEYDPEIEVFVGSLIDNDDGAESRIDFVNNFYTSEIYPYIDAMCFHIYTANQYAENTKFNTQSADYDRKIKEEGGWKSLTVTEMGWPVGTWAAVTPEKQASELVKRAILSDAMNYDFVTFYEFKNTGTDTSNYEHMLGILEKDRTPRPAYYSLKEYFKNAGRATFIGRVHLVDGMRAYAYAGNDDIFLVVWAENYLLSTNIKYDSYKDVKHTFNDNVTITDMFGNVEEGNTVNPTYAPMYVHGISKENLMKFIGDYGSENVMGNLNGLLTETEYSNLEHLYNSIISEGDYESIISFVNACYDLGESKIMQYSSGEIAVTKKEFSYLLSEINDVAEFVAKYVVLCDDAPNNDNGFVSEYNRINSILDFTDRIGVQYLSEPCEEIMDIQKQIAKYKETTRINPMSGNNYTVSEIGRVTVSGTANMNSKAVSIKISKEGEIKYLTTLDTSNNKEYQTGYNLPEFGTYTLEIYDGEKIEEEIIYHKNGYISMEDKMTSVGNLRSKRLLKWTKLLLADYLENKKGYVLATEVTKDTATGNLIIDYSNTDYEVYVAVYVGDKVETVAMKNDEGCCVVDVSGLSDYTIRAYVWENMIPKSHVVEY